MAPPSTAWCACLTDSRGKWGPGEMAQLPPFEEPGNLLHGGLLGHFRHVIDQDEADGDVTGLELQRHGRLGGDTGGVNGEDAVVTQDLATDREVPGKVHLDDVVDALPMR